MHLTKRQRKVLLVAAFSIIVLVEVELLYNKRGKWIALTIRFVNDEDREKISGQF